MDQDFTHRTYWTYFQNESRTENLPDKKRTMTSEFRIENHWMLVWGMLSRI